MEDKKLKYEIVKVGMGEYIYLQEEYKFKPMKFTMLKTQYTIFQTQDIFKGLNITEIKLMILGLVYADRVKNEYPNLVNENGIVQMILADSILKKIYGTNKTSVIKKIKDEYYSYIAFSRVETEDIKGYVVSIDTKILVDEKYPNDNSVPDPDTNTISKNEFQERYTPILINDVLRTKKISTLIVKLRVMNFFRPNEESQEGNRFIFISRQDFLSYYSIDNVTRANEYLKKIANELSGSGLKLSIDERNRVNIKVDLKKYREYLEKELGLYLDKFKTKKSKKEIKVIEC